MPPTLGSLNQFLLKNIKLFKLFYCCWHFFQSISIPIKEQIFLVSIWYSTMSSNYNWEKGFMSSPSLQKTFNVLCIHLVPFPHMQFLIHQFLTWPINLSSCLKTIKLEFSSFNWSTKYVDFAIGCSTWWHFKSLRNKGHLFSTIKKP